MSHSGISPEAGGVSFAVVLFFVFVAFFLAGWVSVFSVGVVVHVSLSLVSSEDFNESTSQSGRSLEVVISSLVISGDDTSSVTIESVGGVSIGAIASSVAWSQSGTVDSLAGAAGVSSNVSGTITEDVSPSLESTWSQVGVDTSSVTIGSTPGVSVLVSDTVSVFGIWSHAGILVDDSAPVGADSSQLWVASRGAVTITGGV